MANVLVLTYWNYNDALIQTYTLPYVRIIRRILGKNSKVYLLTLEKDSTLDKQRVAERLAKEGLTWVPMVYEPFGLKAFRMWMVAIVRLIRLIRKEKIDILHCWCTPAGAIGYLLSVLTGRQLVLDSYEPHADAMVENGTWKKTGLAYRLLFFLERKQTERAKAIVSTTSGMKEYAQERYNVNIDVFFVKPACVNLQLFGLIEVKNETVIEELLLENKIIGVYAGKFGGIYLDQEIFDFFAVAARYWGPSFRVLLLTNAEQHVIANYCRLAGLDKNIVITRFVPHHHIPRYMGVADFALTFVRPVPSKRYCTPIKDGEYWALGLPVVIPAGISDDSRIIGENNIGAVLKEFNHAAYFSAVLTINTLIRDSETRFRIRKIAEKYRDYSIAERVYQALYGDNKLTWSKS